MIVGERRRQSNLSDRRVQQMETMSALDETATPIEKRRYGSSESADAAAAPPSICLACASTSRTHRHRVGMTALSILVVGLLLGMKHATEADHLAAVATLATRDGSLGQTLRQGVAWGIGHTLTLMLFGGAVLWLGAVISTDLEQALETAVGAMLIVLGADVLRRLVRDRVHFHAHRHVARSAHFHAHSHRGDGPHGTSTHRHAHPRRWPVRALVVLTMQTMPSVGLGLGYIALFGLGSIGGMALLSIVIAVPLKLSSTYLTRAHHAMKGLVGVCTCALGIAMIVQIGYLKALLS